tara:strand:+ start:1939 stop:3180 length:1242 start_codon:yes stop_codon:yes gene_type:complete
MSTDSYSYSESDSCVESIDNEPLSQYKLGGYYPVSIGELFNNRYRIIKKLGWGVFSTVWLVYDYQEVEVFKVLKIQRADETATEAANDEIDIVKKVQPEYGCHLIEDFTQESIFGVHLVLVFHLCGENLLSSIRIFRYNGLPPKVVKKIAKQLLLSLIHIHETVKVVHTDIKPENILIATPSKEIKHIVSKYKPPPITEPIRLIDRNEFTMNKAQKKRYKKLKKVHHGGEVGDDISSEDDDEYLDRLSKIKMVDFGNAQWVDNTCDMVIQTRPYRAPEVIIAETYDETADLWSIACTIYELLTGDHIFNAKSGKGYNIEDDHLALICGTLDSNMLCYKDFKYYQMFYNDKSESKYIKNIRHKSIKNILKQNYSFSEMEAVDWERFFKYMFVVDYTKRPSAGTVFKIFNHWLSN